MVATELFVDPTGHAVHADDPDVFTTVPAAQRLQTLLGGVSAYVPASHAVQFEDMSWLLVPAWH
jgi:hypothetical protein